MVLCWWGCSPPKSPRECNQHNNDLKHNFVKYIHVEASLRKSESKFTFYLSGVEGKIPPLRKNFLLI